MDPYESDTFMWDDKEESDPGGLVQKGKPYREIMPIIREGIKYCDAMQEQDYAKRLRAAERWRDECRAIVAPPSHASGKRVSSNPPCNKRKKTHGTKY